MQWMFDYWGQHLNLNTFIAYNVVKNKKNKQQNSYFLMEKDFS